MYNKTVIMLEGKVNYWVSENWNEEKITLFFLHGLTADHRMFDKQYIFFADKYNVIL